MPSAYGGGTAPYMGSYGGPKDPNCADKSALDPGRDYAPACGGSPRLWRGIVGWPKGAHDPIPSPFGYSAAAASGFLMRYP